MDSGSGSSRASHTHADVWAPWAASQKQRDNANTILIHFTWAAAQGHSSAPVIKRSGRCSHRVKLCWDGHLWTPSKCRGSKSQRWLATLPWWQPFKPSLATSLMMQPPFNATSPGKKKKKKTFRSLLSYSQSEFFCSFSCGTVQIWRLVSALVSIKAGGLSQQKMPAGDYYEERPQSFCDMSVRAVFTNTESYSFGIYITPECRCQNGTGDRYNPNHLAMTGLHSHNSLFCFLHSCTMAIHATLVFWCHGNGPGLVQPCHEWFCENCVTSFAH